MSEMSDHDLLVRIDERCGELKRCLAAHLARHWAVTLAAGVALLTAAASLLMACLGGH